MSFQNISSIQHLPKEEIQKKIVHLKKEILELKIRKSTRQTVENHVFKHKKHELAQLLTLKTQQNLHI